MPKQPADLLTPNLPPAAKPLADDPWQTAILHASNVQGGVRMTIAACIALGLELNQLKKDLGYLRGGDRKGSKSHNATLIPWKEIVYEKTGFSYDQCNRFMRTAEIVRGIFLKSRKKAHAAAKELVSNPPRAWNIGDYAVFAGFVADHFEATTFKDLMLETGLTKPPKKDPPKEESEESTGPAYTPQMAANDTVALPICDLAHAMAAPDEFKRHLDQLPLETQEADEAADTPEIIGLLQLESILTEAVQAISADIKEKRKANRK